MLVIKHACIYCDGIVVTFMSTSRLTLGNLFFAYRGIYSPSAFNNNKNSYSYINVLNYFL